MSVQLNCLFDDTEAEDCLLRNIPDFNSKFNDAKGWSERNCRSILTDEELQRYEDILPEMKPGTKRATIIAILKANPSLRSTNPDIIFQRISFYLWQYSEKTDKIRRRKKDPILTSFKKIQGIDE